MLDHNNPDLQMIESKRLRTTKSSRCELRILDYRNGKYQGMTEGSNLQPSGMGLAINEDFLLAIGVWKKSRMEGEVFIIYPDETIFYGFLKGDFPNGICCYQVARKMEIFGLLQNSQEDLFVIDWKGAKTLVFLSISPSLRKASNQKGSPNDYIRIEGGAKEANYLQNVQIVKQYRYNSSDQKWDAIEKYFKQIVKIEMKSYKHFLRYHFNSQVAASNLKLQLVELKDEVQINLAGTSIMCRITDNPSATNDFKVKMIGFFDHEQRGMDFYRKQERSNVVEEGVNGETISYDKYQPYRPLDCLKRLKRYYRQSLNFKNQFLDLAATKTVKSMFMLLERYVNEYCTTNYAQKLLQNPRIPPARVETKYSKELAAENAVSDGSERLPLKKMKQDIDRQVRLKRESMRMSPGQLQRSRRASPRYLQREGFDSRRQVFELPTQSYPLNEQQNYSQGKRSYKYLYENPAAEQSSKRLGNKKSYVYLLDESSSRKMEMEDVPKFDSSSLRFYTQQYDKIPASPHLKLKDKEQSPRYFRPVSHIQRSRHDLGSEKLNNKRSEPLKNLVDDYELIQNQLKNEHHPVVLNQYGAYLQKRKVLDQVYRNVPTYEEEVKSRSPSYQKNKSAKKNLKKENERSPSPAKTGKQKASWK